MVERAVLDLGSIFLEPRTFQNSMIAQRPHLSHLLLAVTGLLTAGLAPAGPGAAGAVGGAGGAGGGAHA